MTLQPGPSHIQAAQAGRWSGPGKSPGRPPGRGGTGESPVGLVQKGPQATFPGPRLCSEDRPARSRAPGSLLSQVPGQGQAEQASTCASQIRPSSDPHPPVETRPGSLSGQEPSSLSPSPPPMLRRHGWSLLTQIPCWAGEAGRVEIGKTEHLSKGIKSSQRENLSQLSGELHLGQAQSLDWEETVQPPRGRDIMN